MKFVSVQLVGSIAHTAHPAPRRHTLLLPSFFSAHVPNSLSLSDSPHTPISSSPLSFSRSRSLSGSASAAAASVRYITKVFCWDTRALLAVETRGT